MRAVPLPGVYLSKRRRPRALNAMTGAKPSWPASVGWLRLPMRYALASRDMTRIYRELQRFGHSQQAIARIVGQSQPEVSAIIHGRRVMAYDVMWRTFEGLGAPLCVAGMGRCCDCCGHLIPEADPDQPDDPGPAGQQ